MLTDWDQVFPEILERNAGATPGEIAQLIESIAAPLSEAELISINQSQQNPFQPGHQSYDSYRPFDPRLWRLPSPALPEDYLSLLQWCNGGVLRSKGLYFGPLFSTTEVRGYMLAYHIPEYMPDAIPIGMNGGGDFYMYDMRAREPAPALFLVDSAIQCFKDAKLLGTSLRCICTGLHG